MAQKSESNKFHAGVVLAAKYALPPNLLCYCGKPGFIGAMEAYVHGSSRLDSHPSAASSSYSILTRVEVELKKFRAHYAYLRLIAKENDLEPFDLQVVRAFWIGNELLDSIPDESMRHFIVKDLFPPKQRKRAKLLADAMPKGMVPHHSFNPLYINFVSETLDKGTKNLDACCVMPAKIVSSGTERVSVIRNSITDCGSTCPCRFAIQKKRTTIDLERSGFHFIKSAELETGDLVSVHWGMGIEKISSADANAILKYTKKNISRIKKN